jgi:hypothetical protein
MVRLDLQFKNIDKLINIWQNRIFTFKIAVYHLKLCVFKKVSEQQK